MAVTPLFTPLVCIVDFHHTRGPEVERWFGVDATSDPALQHDWSLLPFLALPDGAHSSIEEISYFTLRYKNHSRHGSSTCFGIACTRQIMSAELINRPADVKRSTVQKAVVAIVHSPGLFPRIREQLSAVTKAWFAQRDFGDTDLLQRYQESLTTLATAQLDSAEDGDVYFGLSLRELIHEYKAQLLTLFKCCLLQPKMLFFGSRCEKLCLVQFALISLIPGLLHSLQDCADINSNTYEELLVASTSLRTSERASLLAYMGLPLQIFGKGSFLGPYTPIQQLDSLVEAGAASYIVGTTNRLLLRRSETISDVLVNLDDTSIRIMSPLLKNALVLSASDRRWIDGLTQTVVNTWDEAHPSRPNTHEYTGSEDFIRTQFEEYLLALLASVKYRFHVHKHRNDPKALLPDAQDDPASDFATAWVDMWVQTDNFRYSLPNPIAHHLPCILVLITVSRIFNKFTDSHIFDIVEPRHPCAGGLTMEDVQRRISQQVADLHIDERLASSKDLIGKSLVTGQQRISSAINALWADSKAAEEQI